MFDNFYDDDDKFQKELQIESLTFEWDERKNQLNIEKHGISFETAAHVFFDQDLLEIYDDEHSDYHEDRYIAIGRIEEVLYVVYTDREDNIRLISARPAESFEERLYYERKGDKS